MRAAERLGLRDGPGRLSLSEAQYEELRDELGATPRIEGLTPTEVKALAALRQAPLGLVSARAVASRAGLSPTAASRALKRLEQLSLVYRESAVLALGRARRVEVWHANVLHPDWGDMAGSLDAVRPPRRPPPSTRAEADRVPGRLHHLFWNVDPAQLDVSRAGPFIARRLLRSEDPEGLAWGAAHLKPGDWRRGAQARGFDRRTRAMAANLAKYAVGLEPLAKQVSQAGTFAIREQLEKPTTVAGLQVAGLKDLLAMKLKVLGERGELRDYFDVKAIDERSPLSVEDGIALFLARYRLEPASDAVKSLIRAMGYLDDVDEDPSLPATREELTTWWQRRQAELIAHLARTGME